MLTDTERKTLYTPEKLDIGSYYKHRNTTQCNFIVSVDARPLLSLIDSATSGYPVYELMSVKRPGDILFYLYINFIDVDSELIDSINSHTGLSLFLENEYLTGAPLSKLDACFLACNEESEEFEINWHYHRQGNYWKKKLDSLLNIVQQVQETIRKEFDYLIKHEIELIDKNKHYLDYYENISRSFILEETVDYKSTLDRSLFELIKTLAQSNKVQSVSCPLNDFVLWRMLIEEQVIRSQNTGKHPQLALFLSGPDFGLSRSEIKSWGGDLFILPKWRKFRPEKTSKSSPLSHAIGSLPCHYILMEKDYGEIECATRTVY